MKKLIFILLLGTSTLFAQSYWDSIPSAIVDVEEMELPLLEKEEEPDEVEEAAKSLFVQIIDNIKKVFEKAETPAEEE